MYTSFDQFYFWYKTFFKQEIFLILNEIYNSFSSNEILWIYFL